jgi:hypothetical protein
MHLEVPIESRLTQTPSEFLFQTLEVATFGPFDHLRIVAIPTLRLVGSLGFDHFNRHSVPYTETLAQPLQVLVGLAIKRTKVRSELLFYGLAIARKARPA